ncbi:Glycosyltransferase, catalytic subunit of cellulose synthase and poly-beta-1,6-N-acetylglucosamine synthase [Cyclobacterium lianum]|uniref:Glycosyltransferase, catalytic subunit of cellulose synthase and poly-beta-1,6-N-acetylglucosamine synthase n=1 Tax=Cyclobacterium lianum TaxID=388280 RepID=A0A1M7P9A4_9BACT|nr:glycosyltransferase [Cyclobacterium lianum]SHN13275.1 Glycosyltransferase, catalytic subunit of cellulose synthase and poly-beta-1,6-N-acetylglucosamine synthase [Cyclobacterium lianum]
MRFSVIIPVYNRPEELQLLLESLCKQTYEDFEVVLVDDGSEQKASKQAETFKEKINLQYHYQNNTGQGFARNKGMQLARGDYFVFFDSDCVIPAHYLQVLDLAIQNRHLQAHGGPDDANHTFNDWQKAMNFSMTSLLTTGGIRGKMKDPSKYQARGYNMGFSREVYDRLGGFVHPNMAEDIEISLRIKKAGYRLELVPDAFVYHQRKNDYWSFLRQSFQFGRNRLFIRRFHPDAVKLVHLLPAFFLLGLLAMPLLALIWPGGARLLLLSYVFWTLALFFTALGSLKTAFLAILTSYGQLLSYGLGMLAELIFPSSWKNTGEE